MRQAFILTRRGLLILTAGAAARLDAAGQDFWNKKPPSEWSAEEIDRLVNDSPWAKAVRAEYAGDGEGRLRQRKGESSYEGTVLWESAQPVQDAIQTPLPAAFADHYAISVNGFSFSGKDLEPLKRAAVLQPKGKAETHPDLVTLDLGNGTVMLYGFAKDTVNVGPEDKEVLFQARFGGFQVKTRFTLKDMTYKGQLAL